MKKPVLPVYSIDSLNGSRPSKKEFMADGFAHYLEEHRNLHFPHKHSFYHLVYFSGGAGSHAIDFVQFPLKAGQIYFMAPGQVHSWDFEMQPDGYIVNFSESWLQGLVANPRYLDQFIFFGGNALEQVIGIPEEGRAAVEALLQAMVHEGRGDGLLKEDYIRAALVQLFVLVSRYTGDPRQAEAGNYNAVLLRNFQKLIELHYKEKKLTKEYAALLYVTPNHLNALSKDVTGRSAGELIRDRVLLEAKRLLVNARLSIAEIAAELQFQDNSYFSKFFKKYEGVTPEMFRGQFVKKAER